MRFRVVLMEPEHEGNVGVIARIMKNFGFHDLWIVNPKFQPGPADYALAAHAKDIVNAVNEASGLATALEGVERVIGATAQTAKLPRNLLRTAITPRELGRLMSISHKPAALLLGRESRGLSNNEIANCNLIVTIPCDEEYKTMNVAIAAGIILYELYLGKTGASPSFVSEASAGSRKLLVKHFSSAVAHGMLPAYRYRLTVRAFSNLVERSFLSEREASLLMGAFRRIASVSPRSSSFGQRTSLK